MKKHIIARPDPFEVRQHFASYFEDHEVEEFQWEAGPMKEIAPFFRVLRFAPGPKFSLWCYVSVGASTLDPACAPLELAIFSAYKSARFVELVTMSSYYHLTQKLGLGHTVPLGEAWVPRSNCTAYMVSLPYPLGPDFEICKGGDGNVHALWLLPITEDERVYKIEHGQEALESIFDEQRIEYWDFMRQSATVRR